MESSTIKLLLAKFLRGECSAEEVDQIIAYLQEHDDPSVLPSVQEVVNRSSHPTLSSEQADRLFQNIIRAEKAPIDQVRRFPVIRWAAAISVFLLLAGLVYFWLSSPAPVTYATDFGQIKTVQLPDGSIVSLNGHSQLRHSADWGNESAREVWLEGEGYFSVTHTANHQKFIVHTSDNFSVEVLGTEFSVNDRHATTDVTLRSGKVRVKALQQDAVHEQVMQPGDQLAYQKATQQLTQQRVNPDLYMAWKDNLLLFENTPLSEIAHMLEDTYGMQVQFGANHLRELPFTGANPADDIDLLLKTLEKSFKLTISRTGTRISIEDRTP